MGPSFVTRTRTTVTSVCEGHAWRRGALAPKREPGSTGGSHSTIKHTSTLPLPQLTSPVPHAVLSPRIVGVCPRDERTRMANGECGMKPHCACLGCADAFPSQCVLCSPNTNLQCGHHQNCEPTHQAKALQQRHTDLCMQAHKHQHQTPQLLRLRRHTRTGQLRLGVCQLLPCLC